MYRTLVHLSALSLLLSAGIGPGHESLVTSPEAE